MRGIRIRGVAFFAAVAVAVALAMPAAASADGPHTDTFNFTGGEQTFHVPTGVTSVSVVVYGAAGGRAETSGAGGGPGGTGSRVAGTLTVTGGDVLYVEVGGKGQDGGGVFAAGGFNGGADGGTYNAGGTDQHYGGGGGGASDLRGLPRSSGLATDARLIIGAGGGGGGAYNNNLNGGPGGNADSAGGNGGENNPANRANSANGGGAATASGPGAGGAGGQSAGNGTGGDNPGLSDGGLGGPGQGISLGAGGGGGGGGRHGGGGGGGGGGQFGGAGGGGGGGSSLVPSGGAGPSIQAADATGNGLVTMTYTPPPGYTPVPQGTGSPANPTSGPGPTGPGPSATPMCVVPDLVDGHGRTIAGMQQLVTAAGCAVGVINPNPLGLGTAIYYGWDQDPAPGATAPVGTKVSWEVVPPQYYAQASALASATKIKRGQERMAVSALAADVGKDVDGIVAARIKAALEPLLTKNLDKLLPAQVAALITATVGGPVAALIGQIVGGKVSASLAQAIDKLLPRQLGQALVSVKDFISKTQADASQFFSPVGKFFRGIRDQVASAYDRYIGAPLKVLLAPIDQYIGHPLSVAYHEVLNAIHDTIGRPIDQAIQAIKGFGNKVGCKVRGLFGGHHHHC